MSVKVLYVRTGHIGHVSEAVARILIGRGECVAAWDRPEVPTAPKAPKNTKEGK